MIKNYMKIAFRNLLKYKGYSFINITGLAIGMTCCLLLLLYVQDEISYDKYHEKSKQIYRLVIDYETNGQVFPNALSSAPMAPQLLNDFPDIIEAVRFYPSDEEVLISYEDRRFFEPRFFYADASVFDVFSFKLLQGDPKTALVDPYSVVITETSAKKYFTNEEPIGKFIRLENKDEYKVTGIMQDVPDNSHFHFDFLASFKTLYSKEGAQVLNSWTYNPFYTYLLLPKNYPTEQLEIKLPDFAEKYAGSILNRIGWKWKPWLQSLTNIHLYPLGNEIESGSAIKYVYIFSAIALFILLIACINFMNLASARFATRAQEVGLRKVIGANRFQLIKQFLGESIVLACMSLMITILLIELFLPAFNKLIGKQLEIHYSQNLLLLGAFIGVTLIVGIISGSYPALFLSALQPATILKGTLRVGSKNFTIRKVLVVVQFAISIILISSTVIVLSQLTYMKNKTLGINKEQIVVIPIRDESALQKYKSLKNELLQNSGIFTATFANRPPGSGASGTSVYKEGKSPDNLKAMKYLFVDHDFISTLEIELAAGRDFSTEHPTDATEAFIINEQAVMDLGWNDPEEAIGQRIVWSGKHKGTVIGVTKNFHFQPLQIFMQPLVLKIEPNGFQYLLVRISPHNISKTLHFISNTWTEFAPNWPFVYSFLGEDFDKLYHLEERFSNIFANFSFLSIFIACLGLFGLASFSAEQRTKEIGIRRTLGASASKIVFLLSQEFIKLALVSNIISWPIAYYFMNKWLQNFSFRINLNLHLWTFALAGILALIIAMMTVSYQAIKVSRVNPVDSLKYE